MGLGNRSILPNKCNRVKRVQYGWHTESRIEMSAAELQSIRRRRDPVRVRPVETDPVKWHGLPSRPIASLEAGERRPTGARVTLL